MGSGTLCCWHGRQQQRVPDPVLGNLESVEVYASTLSLLPRIWAVEAVGMGANSREFRIPCLAILAFRLAQSCRLVGVTPHMSYCNCPLLTGLPSYVSYVPNSAASSQLASRAP